MKKHSILILLTAALAVGCADRGLELSDPLCKSDVESIVADAEFISGQTDSTKVIRISANRSWYAHLNDKDNPVAVGEAVPWGYLSQTSCLNLKGNVQEVDLVVTFKRNYSREAVNGVIELYSNGKLARTIDVTQEGAVYRLDATTDVDKIGEGGREFLVNIDCNTNWTISVDPSSTAMAELEKTSGFDPSSVKVTVFENEDMGEKTLTLKISAEDCEDKQLSFSQDPSTLDSFEIFTTFSSAGEGQEDRPVLVLDNASMKPEVFEKGVKFYYTTSSEGFDALQTPTKDSPELTSDSVLELLPETQSKTSDSLFVCIMGVCEGYRNTYTRVYFKNWKIGTKHINGSKEGIVFTKSFYQTATIFNYSNDAASEIQTVSRYKGSAVYGFKFHTTKAINIGFKMGEEDCGTAYYKSDAVPKADPIIIVSEKGSCVPGQLNRITLSGRVPMWGVSALEQFKYRP